MNTQMLFCTFLDYDPLNMCLSERNSCQTQVAGELKRIFCVLYSCNAGLTISVTGKRELLFFVRIYLRLYSTIKLRSSEYYEDYRSLFVLTSIRFVFL